MRNFIPLLSGYLFWGLAFSLQSISQNLFQIPIQSVSPKMDIWEMTDGFGVAYEENKGQFLVTRLKAHAVKYNTNGLPIWNWEKDLEPYEQFYGRFTSLSGKFTTIVLTKMDLYSNTTYTFYCLNQEGEQVWEDSIKLIYPNLDHIIQRDDGDVQYIIRSEGKWSLNWVSHLRKPKQRIFLGDYPPNCPHPISGIELPQGESLYSISISNDSLLKIMPSCALNYDINFFHIDSLGNARMIKKITQSPMDSIFNVRDMYYFPQEELAQIRISTMFIATDTHMTVICRNPNKEHISFQDTLPIYNSGIEQFYHFTPKTSQFKAAGEKFPPYSSNTQLYYSEPGSGISVQYDHIPIVKKFGRNPGKIFDFPFPEYQLQKAVSLDDFWILGCFNPAKTNGPYWLIGVEKGK